MKITIDKVSKIAIVDVGEACKISDMQEATTALLAHPDHIDNMESIFDFRNANLESITSRDMKIYAKWLAPYVPRLALRIAILVARDLEFGIVRMWDVYSENDAPQQRKVFRDMDKAREWLLSERQ